MLKAKIYLDPITRKKLEGVATIMVEYGEFNQDGLKTCTVRFDNDDGLYVRRVHRDDFYEEKEG